MVEVDARAPFHRRRPWVCCCGITFCIILLIVIIIVILAFTVFKPKDAEISVSNIELQDFTATLLPRPTVNVTLSLDISVYNPNRASLKYTNSSAMVYYHDDEVAVVPIPSGVIGSHDTTTISTTLVVLADQLVTNSRLPRDFLGGSLPFETRTKLSGRVKVLFITRHIDISSQCSISISIINRSISNQDCQNKVHV